MNEKPTQGAFSNAVLGKALRTRVKSERRTILKSRIQYLKIAMKSLNSNDLKREIDDYLLLSNQICCKSKPSFLMEEATYTPQFLDKHLTPYICRSCGFIHFGHDSEFTVLAVNNLS
jgi:hypothetical protein